MSRITEINDILFEQIKLMADRKLKDKKLRDEVERSRTIATLTGEYISCEILEMKKQAIVNKNAGVERYPVAGYLTQD